MSFSSKKPAQEGIPLACLPAIAVLTLRAYNPRDSDALSYPSF